MKAFLSRIRDWSHWPFGLFYFPLFPVWLWYCLKGRSLWFFSSSNPRIPFGGFEGESKCDIYTQLPNDSYPQTRYVDPAWQEEKMLQQVRLHELTFPLIVKPDVGMDGIGVRKIDDLEALLQYHARSPFPYLIQEFIALPQEVSIFYYRYPGCDTGHVSAFIAKDLPRIQGNGISTVGELISRQIHTKRYIRFLKRQHGFRWHSILGRGEELVLSLIGNRWYGARFTDLSAWINPALVRAFDSLSHFSECLYYGRYDIMCRSVEEMAEGKNFVILEFNGAGSIPNHVFAGRYTLIQAYLEIIRHWQRLYHISRLNQRRGAPLMSFAEGYRFLKQAKKHLNTLRRLENSGWL